MGYQLTTYGERLKGWHHMFLALGDTNPSDASRNVILGDGEHFPDFRVDPKKGQFLILYENLLIPLNFG